MYRLQHGLQLIMRV